MTHIEFLGPPGAGKSTVHRQILDHRRYSRGNQRQLFYPKSFDDFVTEYPGFLSILSHVKRETPHDGLRLVSLCRRTAQVYQAGIMTIADDAVLCLDEGFAMRAASILYRYLDKPFPIDDYLRWTPTPKVVVYIDAPVDVCLNRQQDRGRMAGTKDWIPGDDDESQRRCADICRSVKDSYKERTVVITLENTNDIDSTVSVVRKALDQVSSGGVRD